MCVRKKFSPLCYYFDEDWSGVDATSVYLLLIWVYESLVSSEDITL